jgi:L-galactose dehydrogenase
VTWEEKEGSTRFTRRYYPCLRQRRPFRSDPRSAIVEVQPPLELASRFVIYRTLAHTGLRVSALAFGGSSLGGAFGPIDEAEGIRAVRTAIDQGINLFDTAPYYGDTLAETVLGRALDGVSRDRFVLATKVGRYGPNLADFDFSAERVTRSVDESLQRLRTDTIDLIQVHDIEFGDLRQIIDETLPALERVRAAGKARFIGITGLHLHLLGKVLSEIRVDAVQSYCHGTVADSTLLEWLPKLEKADIGVLNSAPLAMRLLTDSGPPAWHPAPIGLRARCAEAAAYCRARGQSLARLALGYSLRLPGVHSTVVGAATSHQVLENIRTLRAEIDSDLLQGVREILAPVHNLGWPSGRDENQP